MNLLNEMSRCRGSADNELGPLIINCGQFDFTLKFEHLVFGIALSAIFLLLAPFRLRTLQKSGIRTLPDPVQIPKFVNGSPRS
jgi:hypothetical protein